jgi:hypothetical protein
MQTATAPSAMATGPGGMPGWLWNLPALPPPKGKVPNFDHPESRGTELIIITVVFLTLTLLAVSLRFLARRNSKDVIGWDGCKLSDHRNECR